MLSVISYFSRVVRSAPSLASSSPKSAMLRNVGTADQPTLDIDVADAHDPEIDTAPSTLVSMLKS